MWLKRLATALFVPILVLLVIEALLRLVGFGHPTSFFLRTTIDGRPVYVDNAKFAWRFFTTPALARKPWPFVLPVAKPDNAYRIFLLGESAAMGDPDPSFGCARILERMLRAEYPGVDFEIVNAGMVAINSHVIRCIARDCARLQPDAFVIYMGNNEVVGPYGPGTAFHSFSSSLALIRAGIFMRGTRIGQLVDALVRLPARAKGGEARWNGMQQFLEHRIRADDPRLPATYEHFRENLNDICAAGRSAGAQIVRCTVAVNLGSSPPFGAADDANAAFREGRFADARDLDTLRFRADSGINRAIRTAGPGDEILDAEMLFSQASPKGVPGDELFLDHVHMNFAGNYLLARAVLDKLAATFPARIAELHAPQARLTEQQCARLLAFTDWDRFSMDESMYRRLQTPPFTFQLDHEKRAAAAARDLDGRRSAVGADGLQKALADYDYAVGQAPDDWVLRQNLGNLLIAHGGFGVAVGQLQRVFKFIPQALEDFYREAFKLADEGKADDAVALIMTHNPDHPRDLAEVYNEMGSAVSANGDPARAIILFGKAVAANAEFHEARYNLALALAQQGRREDAVAEFNRLLAQDPNNADAHYNLAMALAGDGKWDEALQHLGKTLAIDPGDADAHFEAAVILRQRHDPDAAAQHLRAALQIRPDFAQARDLLSEIAKETR